MNTPKMPKNPFILKDYISPYYFCDRVNETKNLINNAINGQNTTLISIRRMGKTGLLHHVLHQLKAQNLAVGIYADMYETENLKDFTNTLANAILNAYPEKDPFWKKAFNFLKLLRPIFTVDELSGTPQVSLDYTKPKQFENTLMELFNFLEKQKQTVFVVIDEFQQVSTYPEKNMEAILRTKIQRLKNVNFVFSGSSPHLLTEMFYSSKRPFYQSTQALFLKKIDPQIYASFIKHHFESNKKVLTEEALDFILEFTKGHTYYTQMLCHRVFLYSKQKIGLENVHKNALEILQLNEVMYFQYRNMLTNQQWQLMKAIAKEDTVEHANSAAFLKKYDLGAASTVQRSLKSLLEKEMIYLTIEENRKYYSVYDCFFSRWLERIN